MGKLISIIVPCYNEQETVERFYEEIIKVTNEINGYEFEFVYVNDGSKDQTVPLIKALRENDERVCLIDFSRNFGK